MIENSSSTDTQTGPLTCYNHPDRETGLRCRRCERPICSECAVLTPTGYICKECQRNQQKKFDTAEWIDYPLAIVVAGVLSYLGSLVAGVMGFFTIFIAPVAGVVIAEAVRWVVRRRRARLLFLLTAGAAAVGGLIRVGIILLAVLSTGNLVFGLRLLYAILYVALVTSSVYYRLSGIQIKR